MRRRSQSILLALLLAFIAGGGWLASRRLAAELDPAPDLGEENATLAADGDDARGLLAPRKKEDGAETEREALALESQGAGRTVPPDALWLDGRVVFPPGTPADEEVLVHARGLAFDGWEGRNANTYSAMVADDGTFRFALARGTTYGQFTLSGHYLFLRARVGVKLRELADALVLEPELGGRIHATVVPPTGTSPDPDVFGDVWVGVISSVRNGSRSMRAPVDAVFAFDALAVAVDYRVKASARPYTCDPRRGVEVRPGETTEVELRFNLGVEVSGRVVAANGVGVELALVKVLSTALRDGARRTEFGIGQTDAKGEFRIRGVPAGSIGVEVVHAAFLPAQEDMGMIEDGAVSSGLVVTLDAGRFIAGLVQWPDGRPAAGAFVEVDQGQGYGGMFVNEGRLTAQTGADGRFRMSGLGDDALKVRAFDSPDSAEPDASGQFETWSAELSEVRPDSANLLLVLSAPGAITGRVVDDLGAPVTRFQIVVRKPDELLQSTSSEFNQRVQSEDGSFAIPAPHGEWRVAAKARGHGRSEPQTITVPQIGSRAPFVLPRAASVSGIVRDRGGAAVPGARVTLRRKPTSIRFFEPSGGPEEAVDTTNGAGEFTFRDVAPGEVRLRATTPWSGTSEWLDLSVGTGEKRGDVDLILRSPARLTGVVSPTAGRVAGRLITVRNGDATGTRRLESDAHGRFEAEGLEPGPCRVTLEPEDGGLSSASYSMVPAMRKTASVELVEGGTVHVVLGAPPENAIRVHGRVLAGGVGVANASVVARFSPGRGREGALARTDSDGAYEVLVSGPGSYHFSIELGDGVNVGYGAEVPDSREFALDFELPSARLTGIVRDAGDQPLAGIEVSLECAAPAESHRGWSPMQRVNTGPTGAFAFERLGAGDYVLRAGGVDVWSFSASATVYGRVAIGGITLERAEARSGVEVVLQRGGHIEARISGLDGKGAQNASLEVRDAAGNKLWRWFPVSTDGSDLIRIRGVGPGRVTVRAFAGDRASDARALDVVEGETTEASLAIE